MKTFLFYTYDENGDDKIIRVTAKDRDAAFRKFDSIYGAETPIDCVVPEDEAYVA